VAVSLAIGAASTTWAGQEIYVGVVGEDDQMNTYYLEPKLWAWLHSETTSQEQWAWDGVEPFDLELEDDLRTPNDGGEFDPAELFETSSNIIDHPPVCITPQEVTNGTPGPAAPANNSLTWDGELERTMWLQHDNAGEYKWRINLPKKPRGNINIVVQCGLLKPNSYSSLEPNVIQRCAGETGERLGLGECTRASDQIGAQVIWKDVLPTVEAIAFPDPTRGEPFHLTAYKTPSNYATVYKADQSLMNIQGSQVSLAGTKSSRIVLKACQPETMLVKIPVQGQINGLGEEETALEAGEEIEVTLRFPTDHPMDVYCDKYSVKIMGLGNPGSQAAVEDEI
jgi:hypothetical protein